MAGAKRSIEDITHNIDGPLEKKTKSHKEAPETEG
jgi:hypothetical protein